MNRSETEFIGEFMKNDFLEKIIQSMNDSLEGPHEEILNTNVENQVNIHVIGVPRSGTTLLTQYLSNVLEIGFVNNFIATFWKAPIYGIELSKKLLGNSFSSKYESSFGKTANINEPHEFGYFWNHMLGYPELKQMPISHEKDIDWVNLNKMINNMAVSFNKPILFKSFLLGFHAYKQYQKNKKSMFIYVERNKIDTAHSILKLRKKLLGNDSKWGSIKPLEYDSLKELDKYSQIAGQIHYLDKAYKDQLRLIGPDNVIYVSYKSFCENPDFYGELIRDKITKVGKMELGFKPSKMNFKSSGGEKAFSPIFEKAFERIIKTEFSSCNK